MNDTGRLVMVDIPGTTLEPDTAEHIRRHGIGGVILFRKNIENRDQARRLVSDLREVMGPEALVAIDQEGGGVLRTSDLPHAPSAMCLGAADDPDLARSVGAAIGRGLRSMGFNWNFAPVLDLNNNPDNPVIADRSFGEDPKRVAALALAWAEGLESAGVAACGKHFPGHGDTSQDSHFDLPTVRRPLAALEEYEFAPFLTLARAGLSSLMTAHIVYPELDPDLPATLSRRILTGLLREEGGFTGVIVTDSMGMKAVDGRWGRGEATVLAVAAGADLVEALGPRDAQVESLLTLERAASEGKLEPAALERSRARLAALARRFPVEPRGYGGTEEAADRALMIEAWGRGLTAVGEPRLPAPGSRVTLVAPEGVPGENVAEAGLDGLELARHLSEVYAVQPILYPMGDPASVMGLVEAAREGGVPLVFASTSRLRLSGAARALAAAARPDLHLVLWNPYAVADVEAPALVTYGYRPEAIAALVRVLRGEARAQGRLPVTLA